MMEETKREITPYRMQQLMNVAADVSNRIVNSRHAYNISFEEIKIVLAIIEEGIRSSESENNR